MTNSRAAKSNKATHSGHCQACGRLQKLPNGKLSKHGYTVEHGFFSGVCRGTNYLPFEQSCDQVRRYIGEAKSEVEFLTKRRTELLEGEISVHVIDADTATVDAIVDVEVTNSKGYGYGARYSKEVVTLTVTRTPHVARYESDDNKFDVTYTYAHPYGYTSYGYKAKTVAKGEVVKASGVGDGDVNSRIGRYDEAYYDARKTMTVEELALATAREYAKKEVTYVIEPMIKRLNNYIVWQTNRVENWKEAPLFPVTAKDKEGFEAE